MEEQEKEVRRIPIRSFILKKKSNFRKVLYIPIRDTVRWKELLQYNLPEKWNIDKPEAIISITGICHQFNIKDKCYFKRDLIKAVTSTGSWIVTCGTESGVVRFIEDAVNEHIALKDCHIPIVGLLSKRVLAEVKKISVSDRIVKKGMNGKWDDIPTISTQETLDPNHTQFIFLDGKRTSRNATSECRKAFEHFLSNISKGYIGTEIEAIDETELQYTETDTYDILPVILVLIEGGLDALKAVWCVLQKGNPVVVIDGSGGAADFLANYFRRATRESSEEKGKLSDSDESIREEIEKYFEDNSSTLLDVVHDLLRRCLGKHTLIHLYSLEDKKANVDECIQKVIFDIHSEFFADKKKNLKQESTERSDIETIALKKQLQLVQNWKNYDIAEKDIFIFKNRKKLSTLQTDVNTRKMRKFRNSMKEFLDSKHLLEDLKDTYATFEKYMKEFKRVKPGCVFSLFDSLHNLKCDLWEKKINTEDKKMFKEIMNNILTEIAKDSVSDLLESSLVANRADLVMLIINRMEDMQSFVYLYIPFVYQKSIWESDEELPISLIEQQPRYTEEKHKYQTTNTVLISVRNFLRDLLGDRDFKLYEELNGDSKLKSISIAHADHPFHHLFVWAVLVNWKDMAMLFWKHDSDYICSALFASAVLKELAERAHFSNHMDLCISLNENSSEFEGNACKLVTEMYRKDRDKALTILVTKVGRYNSTPLEIAYSQKLMKFMAITACQTKLDSIWRGDIALYTPSWRIGVAVFLPILTIQNIGFIAIGKNDKSSNQIQPIEIIYKTKKTKSPDLDQFDYDRQNKNLGTTMNYRNFPSVYMFYSAPIVIFIFYMVTYLVFLGIFATFVLTDMYPLSERSPSVLEYLTWIWTLSLAIEEIRQILQTDRGSFAKNMNLWAKDVWNIFDVVMYLLFLVSVFLRCLLNSEQFFYARLSYAITLSMFILRSMHFFFVTRNIGPKVVMIGRMFQDLAFFIAIYILFLFSFGIMYQAVLFSNSSLSPWELFKDLIYLPYWQTYGELNIDQIEGTEPSKCTNDPQLYTNGEMERCAETNQFNSLLLAVYLILTNILLVNLLIAMFSRTFDQVQDNSEMIWKFHRYALVKEYYYRPMFPIPVVIHFSRVVRFCYDKIVKKTFSSAFISAYDRETVEKLHVVEKIALDNYENRHQRARSTHIPRDMMTDERDMIKEIDFTPTQRDIQALHEDMQRIITMIKAMKNVRPRQPI